MKTMDSDLDFYCYLKANLPRGYAIVAEPSAEYYSEWRFSYRVLEGTRQLWNIGGDFRTLRKGTLVRRARSILKRTGSRHDNWY
ncbi:MAG TPA: hypothetical protein VMH22_15020 [bacterium]|nr:hypothetical protein [bacterium]